MNMQIITIEENDAGQRLDKFLKKFFVNATLSLIYKLNRKSKIKVQKQWEDWFKKRNNEFKLSEGDEVKFFLSDKDIQELSEKPTPHSSLVRKGLDQSFDKADILFEDEDLFIVNKAAWVNVHPGDFKSTEVSLIQQVQDYLWKKYNSLTFKPSLVHRIDRDTSGVIMIAKKKYILTKLVDDFKRNPALNALSYNEGKSAKKIKKTYRALCFWKPPQKSGTIDKKLLRIEWAKNENKVQISSSWQRAISHYTCIESYTVQTEKGAQNISLIEVNIETWRMHQIRVHLASIKCPIMFDKSYGNKSLNYYFEKNFGINRQMLHAYTLDFFHYWEWKSMRVTAELKDDMKKCIKLLKIK